MEEVGKDQTICQFQCQVKCCQKKHSSTCEMCDMVLKMTVINLPSRHASGEERNFKAWVNFTGDWCCRWLTCQLDCDDRAGQERGGRQWRKRSQKLIKICAIVQSLYCLSKLCWAMIQNKGLTKRFIHPLKIIHFQMRHGRIFFLHESLQNSTWKYCIQSNM